MNIVLINREPVELFKLLKFEGLASTGGEAKAFIDDGMVHVNGQIEMRKRRKMMANDVFEFDGKQYRLELELV